MLSQERSQQFQEKMRERMSRLSADTARSTNPQGVDLTGPSLAFRDPEPDPEEKRGFGRMFLDAVNPFSDFNASIRRGAVRGVIGAVDETTDLAVTLGGFAAEITGLGERFGGQDFMDWWAQDDDDRNPLHIGKGIVDNLIGFRGPNTIIGGLVEGITQLGVGMLGVGKVLKLKKAGVVTKALAQGAIADAIFFDANEARLGNLIQNGPEWLRNPLTEFVAGITAAKESDNELEGRFKNALEGLILGGTIGTLMVGARAGALKLMGKRAEARIAVAAYKPEELRGIVELPNGKARLASGADDTAPFLTDVGEAPVGFATHGNQLNEAIESGLALPGGPIGRRYTFTGENGVEGALDVRMESRTMPDGTVVNDVLQVDALGKLEADGRINTNPESGFTAGPRAMRKIAGELIADHPQANMGRGLRTKSGGIDELPLDRFKQEVFDSKGDAGTEALTMADMARQSEAPLDKISKTNFEDMEKLTNAYRTNRSTGTIRRMERTLVKNMRTNLGSGRDDIIGLIADIAKQLDRAGGGSAKVMAANADRALEAFKGTPLEGVLKHSVLTELPEIPMRRAAGLLLESLGDDIARYSIRVNQGGSNLSYLQIGRALDQMVHVEEALTGRPAVWLDKHRALFGEGKLTIDPQGRFANTDAPEIRESTAAELREQAAPAPDKDDLARLTPIEDDLPGEARTLSQGADGEIKVDGASIRPRAGVAPGPASLRNMSKGEIIQVGRWVALADGNPRSILTALKGLRIEALAAAGKPGMKSMLLRWRLSAMLSGVSTQMVNVVSTGIQTALLPTELLVGGVMTGQPRYIREAAHTMMGLVTEAGDAFRASHRAFKAGKGSLDPSFMTRELDAGRFEGFLSVANVPQDFLSSADEFFKVLNYRAKIRAKSLTSSAAAGLDAKASATRMIDDLDNSISADGAGLNTEALEYSRTATFTDALDGSARKLSGVLHDDDTALGVVGQLFVPFIRTPHNIMRNIIIRSPLGMANLAAHNRAIAAGGAEAAAAMGRMATAGALVGTAGLLASQGRITGRGPLHKDVRKAWLAAGYVPYTIQVGNAKINYNRLSSMFGPLAMVADLHYALGNLQPEEALEGIAGITAGMLSYVSDQGFVGNMSEMFDVIISGDASAIQTFVEKTAIGMAVPQALSQFTGLDDTMREAEGFMDELYAKIPGLSDRIPPARNIFREPVMKAPGSMDRIFNPFTQVGPTDNQTALSLFMVGRQMALPGDTRFDGRVELKDTDRWGEVNGMSPYEFWMEATAKNRFKSRTLKEDLTRLVTSKRWARMPPGSEEWPGGPRFVAAARIVKRRSDAGERAMFRAFPSLRRALQQESILKRMNNVGGRKATDRLQARFESFNRKRSR